MENTKLKGLEISIKLDNISADQLRNAINYIFADIIQKDQTPELDHNKEITDKQMKYINSLAKEKNIGKVELQNYSMSMFGKNSSLDLTRNEASQLIAALNDIEYNVLDHLKV